MESSCFAKMYSLSFLLSIKCDLIESVGFTPGNSWSNLSPKSVSKGYYNEPSRIKGSIDGKYFFIYCIVYVHTPSVYVYLGEYIKVSLYNQISIVVIILIFDIHELLLKRYIM